MADFSAREPTPSDKRGTAGKSSITPLHFPEVLPKIYSKIDFFEYRRASDTSPERRQTASIILPVPERFGDLQNIQVNDQAFGMIGFATAAVSNVIRGNSLGGTVSEITGKFDSAAKRLVDSPIQAIGTMLAFAPGSTDLQQRARQFAGVVPNPHVSAVFNGVSLKEFNFNYRFSPRSDTEADMLNRIINTFRARTHPAPGTVAGAIYSLDYPDLATMEIKGAKGITKVGFSFISRFNVTFGSGGNMAFYKDGQPIEVAIDFNMQEIDIRTRQNYDGSSRDVTRDVEGVVGATPTGRFGSN